MKIDKNVKCEDAVLDRKKVGRKSPYPISDLDVGDSFFVAGEDCYGKAYKAAVAMAQRTKNTDSPKKFSGAKVVENGVHGLRIWRTA